MVVGPLLPSGGPNHQTRRGGTPESHPGPPGTSSSNPSSGSPKGTKSGTPSGSGDTPARDSSPHTLGARRPGSGSTTAPPRLLDPSAGVGVPFTSAWAPAQPSPPQLAADPRRTAHLNQGSGGAPLWGTLLPQLLHYLGQSQGVLSSERLGRRGSRSRRHQTGTWRSPGHQEPCSQGGTAPLPQSIGAHAPELSAGSLPISTAPLVQGSRTKGQAAQSRLRRGGPAPTAILTLGPRHAYGVRLHHRSPQQGPSGMERPRGRLARHH
ncbi:hypothetical protein NDU88_005188 [Pleurodeles waltl]|uniref:Uncharacterized protein n=1 Tax=Pleurodeles waltl TaxID=8319 RepID=A0AAV7RN44_PLEWA|nr:hypothetical protein NDU88_005188 [Pleurodeles waltl]